MYSSATGAYAGMSSTATADSFTFQPDGTYQSRHKGISSTLGSTQGFDTRYDGRYTVTPWEIVLTNRSDGEAEQFWCQYQAVRGGRILHLTNKAATGIQYHLAKTK